MDCHSASAPRARGKKGALSQVGPVVSTSAALEFPSDTFWDYDLFNFSFGHLLSVRYKHPSNKVTIGLAKQECQNKGVNWVMLAQFAGRDDGWEEAVSRSSTRKRGQKTYTLSKRRDEKERVHFNKLGSMPVEGDIKNLLMDRHEIVLPDIITDLFMKSLKECTWYRLPATLQESIFKKMAEMKKRAESRKETEVHDERMYEEWDICLTKRDYPFYEHAIKLSNLYRIGNSNPVHRMEMTFNPSQGNNEVQACRGPVTISRY